MLVTVYTTPNCMACNSTKRQFERLGVRYDEVALDQHPDKLKEFVDQGFNQAPIIVADNLTWSGYRHEMIQRIAKRIERETKNDNKVDV